MVAAAQSVHLRGPQAVVYTASVVGVNLFAADFPAPTTVDSG
jgi:hypothetical protein